MTDCLFCRILAGDIPGDIVYNDETVTAFRDINPVAPTHILIIPKKHIVAVSELEEEDEGLGGHLLTVARKLAVEEGIDETGYRLIINNGPDAGQVVFHLHLHLIGGQKMQYPMG